MKIKLTGIKATDMRGKTKVRPCGDDTWDSPGSKMQPKYIQQEDGSMLGVITKDIKSPTGKFKLPEGEIVSIVIPGNEGNEGNEVIPMPVSYTRLSKCYGRVLWYQGLVTITYRTNWILNQVWEAAE